MASRRRLPPGTRRRRTTRRGEFAINKRRWRGKLMPFAGVFSGESACPMPRDASSAHHACTEEASANWNSTFSLHCVPFLRFPSDPNPARADRRIESSRIVANDSLKLLSSRSATMQTNRFSSAQTFCVLGALLCAITVPGGATPDGAPRMLGFTSQNAARQQEIEDKFDASLDPSDQRAWLERMSSEPNHVGSPHDKVNAEFILGKFREWGWDAEIETFYVLYPTPKKLGLEMVAPTRFTARLHEPALDGDRTSGRTQNALPPYHAYGADGDVTAELVYANQGMPADYKELESRGISVKGKIVIT